MQINKSLYQYELTKRTKTEYECPIDMEKNDPKERKYSYSVKIRQVTFSAICTHD
jgi:hypothetical protein